MTPSQETSPTREAPLRPRREDHRPCRSRPPPRPLRCPTVTLVLGGARSGKSAYAERLIGERGAAASTSRPPRPATTRWRSASAAIAPAAAMAGTRSRSRSSLPARSCATPRPERPVLVDCLTLWLGNLMAAERDVEAATAALLATSCASRRPGGASSPTRSASASCRTTPLGRAFRDHAGRLNQAVAAVADRVVFVAAGLAARPQGHRKGRAPRKSPQPIVTGFLGAGKTTLIRHLLRQRRTAAGSRIIINEFGDLGVDRELLLGCGDRRLCRRTTSIELRQRLHLLHRRRRFPADHGAAARPRPSRPTTSSSRPPASRCRSRWSRPSTGRR